MMTSRNPFISQVNSELGPFSRRKIMWLSLHFRRPTNENMENDILSSFPTDHTWRNILI